MCSGRVDPELIFDAFLANADGVFIGGCLRGECHYSTGNLHAETKVLLAQHVLANAGINSARVVLRFMSSGESSKFVKYITEFIESIQQIGPTGHSEGLDTVELNIKLRTAKNTVAGKKIRWVIGKTLEFQQRGNLYGEVFTQHEINRMLLETVIDEYTLQEILLRTTAKPVSIPRLSELMKLHPSRILRHLVDLRKMELVTIHSIDDGIPLWISQHPSLVTR